MPYYNLIHNAGTVSRGGGVGFYIDNILQYSLVNFNKPYSDLFEEMTIEVSLKFTSNIIITCRHRTPSNDPHVFNLELHHFLSSIKVREKIYVLTDDHNFDLLKLNHRTYIYDFHNFYCISLPYSYNNETNQSNRIFCTLIDNLFINTFQY